MEAIITTDGKKIIARIPYAGGAGPRMAKKVPGARAWWDKSKSPNEFLGWVYPLSMDTCRAFRKVFGGELMVSNVLSAWARDEVARESHLEELREGLANGDHLTRVQGEAPELFAAMKSRPYQLAGTGFILAGKTVILGDDPGLGKTLQTLAAMVQNGSRRILVGCRRTATRTVWERETMRWWPDCNVFVAQGSRTEREAAMKAYEASVQSGEHPSMLVVNIEMVRAKRTEFCPSAGGLCPFDKFPPSGHPKHEYRAAPDWPFIHEQEWDAIVFDESHNLLASTANVQSKRITQARFGAVQLRRKLREGGLAVACSGTPFRSKIEKGWGTLNWLQPKKFGSYWRWAEQHFGVEEGRFGKIVGGGEKVLTPLDEEAWDRMLRPWYLKRTKTEAAPDLPPIIYAGTPIDPADPDSPSYVQLEMEPAQEKVYRQMAAEAEAILEDGSRMTATGVLAEITRLRQFANASGRTGEGREVLPSLPSNKVEWIIDFMREREDTGQKVVIASSFTRHIEFIADALRKEGLEVLTLTGATSDRDRSDLVARFQDPADSLRAVVINRIAGGESITLDAADDMVVVDQPWISDQDDQLEARIHRVSRIHQVTVYRLVSSGTVDEWMARLTDEQRAAIATASPRRLSELMKEGASQ